MASVKFRNPYVFRFINLLSSSELLWSSSGEIFLLNEIYEYILVIAYSYGVDIEDGLEKNIAKLKERYPEKFDEDLAVNRDLETERKILEGDKISN